MCGVELSSLETDSTILKDCSGKNGNGVLSVCPLINHFMPRDYTVVKLRRYRVELLNLSGQHRLFGHQSFSGPERACHAVTLAGLICNMSRGQLYMLTWSVRMRILFTTTVPRTFAA